MPGSDWILPTSTIRRVQDSRNAARPRRNVLGPGRGSFRTNVGQAKRASMKGQLTRMQSLTQLKEEAERSARVAKGSRNVSRRRRERAAKPKLPHRW